MAAPRPPSSRRFPALVALLLAYLGTAEAFVASSSLRGIEAHRSAGLQSARTVGRAGLVAMMSERRGLWPGRPTIDLRSDTVTQPTGGMRKAMQKVSSRTCTYFVAVVDHLWRGRTFADVARYAQVRSHKLPMPPAGYLCPERNLIGEPYPTTRYGCS